MYPPSSSLEMMLGEALGVEPSLDNVENNEPPLRISSENLNRSSRRALLKKGGYSRARLQSRNVHNQAQQHPKQAALLRNNTVRLTDIIIINNNNSDVKPTTPRNNTELPTNRSAPSGSTHLKTTSKKEVRNNTYSLQATCFIPYSYKPYEKDVRNDGELYRNIYIYTHTYFLKNNSA